MATVVVDQVISEYALDATKYVSGSKQVVNASQAASNAAQGLGRAMHSAFSGAKSLAVGVGLLSIPMAVLGKGAIDSALAYDTMSRTLKAVTGSAQRAKEVLQFVDKLAIPSIFTSAELGSAAKTLEAFGLKTERFLPIAEKLGTVFGGSAADLEQFVNSLGMLKGGRFGEAFESLARAGISREALGKRGLQFNPKTGELLNRDVPTALKAVEDEVNARFGKLAQEMADGPAAKMASVMDALGRASRGVGMQLLNVLVPVAERLGNAIQNLVDKGYIEKIAKGFTDLFNTKSIGDGMIRMLATMVVALQEMPKFIVSAHKMFSTAFNDMRLTLIKFVSVLAGAFIFGPLLTGLQAIVTVVKNLGTAFKAAGIAAAVMEAIATGGASLVVALAAGTAAALGATAIMVNLDRALPKMGSVGAMPKESDFVKKVNSMYKELSSNGPDTPAGTAGKPGDLSPQVKPANLLSEIRDNTKATADNTKTQNELTDRVLGGGHLGGRGLSKEEIGMASHGKGSRHSPIQRALAGLGAAIDMTMARQTAGAFGVQTSRREI